jgi:hemoglobin-like flavoprotein
MTPEQITLVEQTLASVDTAALTADSYRRAFETTPALAEMFASDPTTQRARFEAELAEIVRTIRSLDGFEPRMRALGRRHQGYGVHPVHYRLMGDALLAALAQALGASWTAEANEAWTLAYNLTAETMMLGAVAVGPRSRAWSRHSAGGC